MYLRYIELSRKSTLPQFSISEFVIIFFYKKPQVHAQELSGSVEFQKYDSLERNCTWVQIYFKLVDLDQGHDPLAPLTPPPLLFLQLRKKVLFVPASVLSFFFIISSFFLLFSF